MSAVVETWFSCPKMSWFLNSKLGQMGDMNQTIDYDLTARPIQGGAFAIWKNFNFEI